MLINQIRQWQGTLLDGRYRLLQLLGRGGMGEVWKAEDTQLHRLVAVKLLAPVMKNEHDYLSSFMEEARTVASLDHPHILPVHDFGEVMVGEDVVTYLVMPLITGGTLRDRIRSQQGPLPIEESLRYLRQAAAAIDHAYRNRIIHRDIKPGNMLLQDGWLFLSDFGLARLLTTTTYRSRTNAGAGTPEYMAPEQIRGRAVAASDRYSLAVVAYQLLSGALPFEDEEPFTVFLKHLNEEPPPPRQFNPQLPEAMERAILKSLAKNPAARHLSSLALVEDLERGWQTRPLSALVEHNPDATQVHRANVHPVDAPTRLKASAGAPVTPILNPLLTRDLHIDQQHEASAQKNAREGTLAPSEPAPAAKPDHLIPRRALLLGGVAAATLLAGGGFAATTLLFPGKHAGPQQLMAGKPVLKLKRHTDTVWNIRWNPQGRYLVTTAGRTIGLTSTGDNRVALWDIESLLSTKQSTTDQAGQIWQLDDLIRAHCIDWSPDGRKLGLVTEHAELMDLTERYALTIIDAFTLNAEPQQFFDKNEGNDHLRYTSLAWAPDGNTVATLTHPEQRDRKQGVALWQPVQSQDIIKFLANPQPARLMDLKPEELPEHAYSTPDYYRQNHCLCWTGDGSKILALDNLLNIRIWDVNTASLQTMRLPDRSNATALKKRPDVPARMYIPTVIPSPTEPTLFATNDLDTIIIADAAQRTVQRQLICDNAQTLHGLSIKNGEQDERYYPQVSALAWSPNGRYIAGAYITTPEIFVWDLQDPQPRKDKAGLQLPTLSFGKTGGHDPASLVITTLAWSPDGRYLASGSFDTTAIIWQMDRAE